MTYEGGMSFLPKSSVFLVIVQEKQSGGPELQMQTSPKITIKLTDYFYMFFLVCDSFVLSTDFQLFLKVIKSFSQMKKFTTLNR